MKNNICSHCNGLGMTSGNNLASWNGRLYTCTNCNGTGKIKEEKNKDNK
jgi:DnaJ-class molecular chaperone